MNPPRLSFAKAPASHPSQGGEGNRAADFLNLKTLLLERSDAQRRGGSILAFSGGPDSVYLLHYLQKEPKSQLHVVYCNHHLRAKPEIERDIEVLRFYETKFPEFIYKIIDLDVAKFAKENGKGLEEAARQLRYDALIGYAKSNGIDRVYTAHHFDDHVETLMMQLLRGTGSGFKGILAHSEIEGVQIHRPLLSLSKQTILRDLELNQLPFSTDTSNSDTALLRNKIRHEILPALHQLNPKFGEHLANLAQDWQDTQACLSTILAPLASQIQKSDQEIFIPKSLLLSQVPPIQKRLLIDALTAFYKKPVPVRAILNQILEALSKPHPTTHHLPEGVRVMVDKRGVSVIKDNAI